MPSQSLEIERVRHAFGTREVLREISFAVPQGGILCVLGPSGCGKTTLLKLIAGIYRANSGTIRINGEDQASVPTHRRNVGFVFQNDLALFPHLNVFENVAFAFKRGGRKLENINGSTSWRLHVGSTLKMTGLDRLSGASVHKLSGGEAQRVALARAIVYRPALLLLDEPLSKVDKPLKSQLIDLLLRIHREYAVSFVYVTHDDREVLSIASHVALLYDGEVRQFGTITDVIAKPATRRAAEILGGWNLVSARALPGNPAKCQIGNDVVFELTREADTETGIHLGIPHLASRLVGTAPSAPDEISLPVEVSRRMPHQGGWQYECKLRLPSEILTLICTAESGFLIESGKIAYFTFPKEKVYELKH